MMLAVASDGRYYAEIQSYLASLASISRLHLLVGLRGAHVPTLRIRLGPKLILELVEGAVGCVGAVAILKELRVDGGRCCRRSRMLLCIAH